MFISSVLNLDSIKDQCFETSEACCPSSFISPDCLAMHIKPTAINLSFKINSDFKVDNQMSATVKCNFYQLKKKSKNETFFKVAVRNGNP